MSKAKTNRYKTKRANAMLWWLSIGSITIGLTIYILLQPAQSDTQIQCYRCRALFIPCLINGLCLIIGTHKSWFEKHPH